MNTIPKIYRLGDRRDLCWRLYYNWFATKHADELPGTSSAAESPKLFLSGAAPERRASL
jgi:hypothetical protein